MQLNVIGRAAGACRGWLRCKGVKKPQPPARGLEWGVYYEPNADELENTGATGTLRLGITTCIDLDQRGRIGTIVGGAAPAMTAWESVKRPGGGRTSAASI
jgi:hypothetical protein